MNCSKSKIQYYRASLGLFSNNRVKTNHIDFLELYARGLNDIQIAKQMQLTITPIYNFRKKYGLPVNKPKKVLEDIIYLKYYYKGLNDYEVADMLNISSTTIVRIRNNLKLPPVYKFYDITLTYKERQILLGHSIADGHLRRIKNTSGVICHSTKQIRYFLWKYENLFRLCGNFKSSTRKSTVAKRGWVREIRCSINTHPILNQFYDLIYKKGKKRITEEFLNQLDDLGLAVWFMDDGTRDNPGSKFCTYGFPKEDVELFRDWLMEKYSISSSVQPSSNALRINAKSIKTFSNIITPHLVDGMKYKSPCKTV